MFYELSDLSVLRGMSGENYYFLSFKFEFNDFGNAGFQFEENVCTVLDHQFDVSRNAGGTKKGLHDRGHTHALLVIEVFDYGNNYL